jgi:23S rRNA pseudouridine1911/1915/1917 synthase
VVYGNIKDDEGVINAPIGRNPNDRKKMAVTYKNSKPATTEYKVIKRYGDFTHIRCILKTGRTHQIRVHMASIGHPVAGDAVYGPKKVIKQLNGQCLHARHIGFVHPRTNEWLEFDSSLPEYFEKFLSQLDNKLGG